IPAAPLPQLSLLANGAGRFVLFDSLQPRSAACVRRAAVQGLTTIDLRDIVPASASLPAQSVAREGVTWPGPESSAREFLERLKGEIESRGGVWVRLADYPFPYQSAICLGIEHLSEELAGFGDIAATLPGK